MPVVHTKILARVLVIFLNRSSSNSTRTWQNYCPTTVAKGPQNFVKEMPQSEQNKLLTHRHFVCDLINPSSVSCALSRRLWHDNRCDNKDIVVKVPDGKKPPKKHFRWPPV